MLIVCPSCSTSYQVGPAALGAAGRSVRCARCGNAWFAMPGEALATAAAAGVAIEPQAPPPRAEPEPPVAAEMAGDFSMEDRAAPYDGDEFDPDGTRAISSLEAPSITPDLPQEPRQEPQVSTVENGAADAEAIETVAARRTRRQQTERRNRRGLLRRLASAPMLIVVLLAALVVAIQWRDKIVRHAPQAASLFAAIGLPVNLRGLVFDNVTINTELNDSMPVLVVEGTIINLTRNALDVPRLRFALRNGAGQEVYAWTALPAKPVLGSGDGLAFRTRLASPPADGRDVIVRFFSRRDVTTGLQ